MYKRQDLVIAPAHDGLRAGNVLTPLGSLHPVDDAWLADARARFPQTGRLPSPRRVLLVGGPTRHASLDDAGLRNLLAALVAGQLAEGGSLSVVASRRTPAAWRDAIAGIDPDIPGLRWRGPQDGGNPYPGLLAWAERIVATPDSVNMLSEAAATRVPLQAASLDSAQGRLRLFVDALRARGRLQPFGSDWATTPIEPLRETARIAAEVAQRLGLS